MAPSARPSLTAHQAAKPQTAHCLLPTALSMSPSELWRFFPLGYLFSILIETPVLVIGLPQRHPLKRRLFAGIWLTACTYPIVVLVFPLALAHVSRAKYLVVAET